MQQNIVDDTFNNLSYLIGDKKILMNIPNIPPLGIFDTDVCAFLEHLSRFLQKNLNNKNYPDLISFAFWIRHGSVMKMKKRYLRAGDNISYIGRGVAFHIAPSNVPLNFAYSLAVGLLAGCSNIVRVSSKNFEQADIVVDAIKKSLSLYPSIADRIVLVKYERDKSINDAFSFMSDVRVIWGGDNTVGELRKSPIPVRSKDITFSDRYSLSILNSDEYMRLDNKKRFVEEFYNDTYLMDQNACTSPRMIVWTGASIEAAKKDFWDKLYRVVCDKYVISDIQVVNKFVSLCKSLATIEGSRLEPMTGNSIIRVKLNSINDKTVEFKDNSGFFYEYDCDNLVDINVLLNCVKVQTITTLGEYEGIKSILTSGIKGVDRITPIGHASDFSLFWDGYDLISEMCRIVYCFGNE